MKYPYTVKHNGRIYAPGTDVPDGTDKKPEPEAGAKAETTPEPKAEKKK